MHELDEYQSVLKFSQGVTPILFASQPGSFAVMRGVQLQGLAGMQLMATAPRSYGMSGGLVELRLEAPDGKLLGTTDPVEPVNTPSAKPPSVLFVPFNREDVPEGPTDLYLVFRHPDRAVEGGLLVLLNAEFKIGDPVSATP